MIGGVFELDRTLNEQAELKAKQNDEAIWSDHKKMNDLSAKISGIDREVSGWVDFRKKINDHIDMVQLAESENDEGMLATLEQEFQKLSKDLKALEMVMMFRDDLDKSNAFLNIHPGAGGTESQDWAEMLLRMYQRWVERHNFTFEVINLDPGEVAGLKDVTIYVKGRYAYGYLKAENGIHRLVRNSPFNANDKRQTSFTSVYVSPEVNEDIKIDIDPKDLKIDTYRSGGAGGQYVNKTESAVRITHLPTGTVVACQIERSQLQNRDMAMRMLKSRLYELEKEKLEAEKAKLQGEKKSIGWGSQIRSYVFMPYQMVKDHRTDIETGNIQNVMDGDIDDFIIGFLKEYRA